MITRRNVLIGGVMASTAAMSMRPAKAAPYQFNPTPGSWRNFEITTQVDLIEADGLSQAWLPLPSSVATDWFRTAGSKWNLTNGAATKRRSAPYGTEMLHVTWSRGEPSPAVTVVSEVSARDRSIDLTKPDAPKPPSSAELALYTRATRLIPTDGIVKQLADKITAGAEKDEVKARRLYEWVVANTFRDPKTSGCGSGDIVKMLKTGDLGGKCADINALFVGLARASGLPARDLYGIRVAPSKFGYRSLGANSTNITGAQHCRAEIYLTKWGWVPVDPADVRKVVLEEPPGQLSITDPKIEAARETLFGAWEGNWAVYNDGHDIPLPGSKQQPIGFLMYPQAETSAGLRDCLEAKTFKYQITSREMPA